VRLLASACGRKAFSWVGELNWVVNAGAGIGKEEQICGLEQGKRKREEAVPSDSASVCQLSHLLQQDSSYKCI